MVEEGRSGVKAGNAEDAPCDECVRVADRLTGRAVDSAGHPE
jgi:hypothetical protein